MLLNHTMPHTVPLLWNDSSSDSLPTVRSTSLPVLDSSFYLSSSTNVEIGVYSSVEPEKALGQSKRFHEPCLRFDVDGESVVDTGFLQPTHPQLQAVFYR